MDQSHWLGSLPIAHRGLHDADAGRPENSLPAFEEAAKHGIPFELDVQITADGTPVVIHDPDVERSDRDRIPVAKLRDSDLEWLRLGLSSEKIPTLKDVLKQIDGRVQMLLDVRRWNFRLDADLLHAVLSVIRDCDYRGPLALMSFDPLAVWRLKRWTRELSPDEWPVGQVSGLLHSAGPLATIIGQIMATNFVTHPAFIAFELAALKPEALPSRSAASWREQLPSRSAAYWRDHRRVPVIGKRRVRRPLVAFTVDSLQKEKVASSVADNFLFERYVPQAYQDRIALGNE